MFEDTNFTPSDNSLYTENSKYRSEWKKNDIEWIRASEMVKNPQFFLGGAARFDVKQGSYFNSDYLPIYMYEENFKISMISYIILKPVIERELFFKLDKGHSFLNHWFVQSSLDTIWGYFHLKSAEVSLKISQK